MKLSDLTQYDKITIQCHDNPDADALASGYGLYCYFRSKGKDVRLVYSGSNKIQKSNLLLMVDKLNLPIEHIDDSRPAGNAVEGLLVTVDCQYGAGNVTRIACDNIAVIDHHQVEKPLPPLSTVNSHLGSCSTLVWKMLRDESFDIDSDANLGTALYYGLYTDTNQFSELYNPLDLDMREELQVDKSLITLFRNCNLSLRELEIAGIALLRHSFNDDYGFAVIKAQPCDPNILGLISDFLLQVDAIKTCVVYNEIQDGYKYSVRSCIKEVNASELAAFLAQDIGSGGGHAEKAGGFISHWLYEEKFPTLHSEAYFNNRMTQYFDSFDLIYGENYQADLQEMAPYEKRNIPLGYVKADQILPVGRLITVRTLERDFSIKVDKNLYLIIGLRGEVYPERRENFERSYRVVDGKYQCSAQMEYVPTAKDRLTGNMLALTDHAGVCISAEREKVYARELTKGVKVFPVKDKNKYMLGQPGDYLAVDSADLHDVFVVEKDVFHKSYREAAELLAKPAEDVL